MLFWRYRPVWAHAALVMLLGTASGALERVRAETGCVVRLPAGGIHLAVETREPADSVGGLVPLAPAGAACHGTITGRWPPGTPAGAGSRWAVTGKWIPPAPDGGRGRGVLVVSRADPAPGRPGITARLRGAIIRTTAALYGERAPLVDALILNRRGSLDPQLSEAYARSGLVHILSISGFHVGLIAGWLYLLGRLARLGRTAAMLASSGLSTLYVAFLGWPAPATRAAALVVLVALCRWRQRQVEPNSLLAVTCLMVLLLDPSAVFDLGAWLSASALWGATTFSRWSERRLGAGVAGRTLGSSIGATLATAPITAAALGSVALIGILLNFAAIPLAALAVPGVVASIVLYPVAPWLAEALAAGAGAGLSLLDGVALLGARVPFGSMVQPVALGSAVPWIVVLGAALWSIGRRNTLSMALLRGSWAAVLACWLWLAPRVVPAQGAEDNALTLHFLQVGQGDGALVRTPGGHWVLIDAGPRFEGADAGKRVVVPFLRKHGVRRLAAVVVSHVHADHLGGVPAVLDRYPADIVIEPGALSPDPRYGEFLDRLEAQATRWHPGRRGDTFTLDSVAFTVLHPDTAWAGWGADLNEDSIVLLVRYRDFAALFTGDAGERAEPVLPRSGQVDLLKVGHHGSRTATTDALLEAVRPRAAVISVGANTYGHPSPAAIGRLERHGVPFWRTDQDGTVQVTTDGATMTLCARRGCRRYPVGP